MPEACPPGRMDLASDRRTRLVLWRLPWLAIAASFLTRSSPLRTTVWTVAFAQMGVACLANASRCGRLHCYFTGPLYLLGALASLLRGLRVMPVAWSHIVLTVLLGRLVLGRLPERIWGKYIRVR